MISSKHLVCGIGVCFTCLATASDVYIVKDGDTLSEIALKHKISDQIFGPNGGVEKLRRLNELSNPDRIYPGDSLKMSPDPSADTTTSSQENEVVLDRTSSQIQPEPDMEDTSSTTSTLEPIHEGTERKFHSSLNTFMAIEYVLGVGVSQSQLVAKFVDQSTGNAKWQSKIASNISLELLHRFARNWVLSGEAGWQKIEYHSPSERLRGNKATNIDFGTKITRDFDTLAFGLGIKQIAINPVVPLLNERYQLTSFQATFITLDLEKEFKVLEAIRLSPHLGFGRLVSGKGYDIEIKSGTLIRGGVTARWSVDYMDIFIEPFLERRFIKSDLGTSLVNTRTLLLGIALLPSN